MNRPPPVAVLLDFLADLSLTYSKSQVRKGYSALLRYFLRHYIDIKNDPEVARALSNALHMAREASPRWIGVVTPFDVRLAIDKLETGFRGDRDRLMFLLCANNGATNEELRRIFRSSGEVVDDGLEVSLVNQNGRTRLARLKYALSPSRDPVQAWNRLLSHFDSSEGETPLIVSHLLGHEGVAIHASRITHILRTRLRAAGITVTRDVASAIRAGATIEGILAGVDDMTLQRQMGFKDVQTIKNWKKRIPQMRQPVAGRATAMYEQSA